MRAIHCGTARRTTPARVMKDAPMKMAVPPATVAPRGSCGRALADADGCGGGDAERTM
jgi:hypothetical protein